MGNSLSAIKTPEELDAEVARIIPARTSEFRQITAHQRAAQAQQHERALYRGQNPSASPPVHPLSNTPSVVNREPRNLSNGHPEIGEHLRGREALRSPVSKPLRAPPSQRPPPSQVVEVREKRPASSVFADDRRETKRRLSNEVQNVSSRPQNDSRPAPSHARSPRPESPRKAPSQATHSRAIPSRAVSSQAVPSEGTQFPDWYGKLSKSTTRLKNSSNQDTLLQRLREEISRCRTMSPSQLKYHQATIRTKLHDLAFEPVTGQLLRNNMMLHNDFGLPQIFDTRYSKGIEWPWDIKADANELYNKWARQDFATDLFRGILRGRSGGRDTGAGDRLDPSFERVSAAYHGNGDLINGQWFSTQLAAVRDGAHGAPVAGIYGGEGIGAYSCIMSGGHHYPDEDHGDTVLYCGTENTTGDGEPTNATRRMLESESNDKPIRLLRSHNLGSQYAPEYGLRYDGLYDVVEHEVLNQSKQILRFKLVRQAGQDPFRGTEPAKRPTQREIDELQKDKHNRGKA